LKIIAVYNSKGGVGKTSTAVNIGYVAAADGAKVLLWDLDPQGASSFYFRVKPKVKGGCSKLLDSRKSIHKNIKATDFEGLDLLPADHSYRYFDLDLDQYKKSTTGIKRILKELEKEYDLVVIDCSPNTSLLSDNIFRAADALLVPVIPTTLSIRTLDQLKALKKKNRKFGASIMPFCSMVDSRKKLHKEMRGELEKSYKNLLKTSIPNSTKIEQMGIERAPLGEFDRPSSAPMRAYWKLWEEVKENI